MRPNRLWIFAAVALTLLFFWKLAFTDLILARGDTYLFFYPLWAVRDAALLRGMLPLWSPDLFMGVPLLSDPQLGTLYPPNWLTVMLSPPDAIRISILGHILWALLGAGLLARRAVRLDMLPALLAGAVFAFGGYLGAHVEQINQLQGLAWIPWALLALHAAIGGAPLAPLLSLAAILALQVLSGHTQTVFMTGVALGIYALVLPFSGQPTPRKTAIFAQLRLLVLITAAAVLAGILALPQLYPTLELTGLSNRGGGFNAQQVMAFSWEPFLIGRGLLPSYDAQIFGEYVAYIGVSGLMMALIAALIPDRRRWVWLAFAGVGVFLALGIYNPVYWVLAELPGFNLFRVPARWLALFALGAAMLSGLGAQHLIHSATRPTRRHLIAVIGILAALIAAAMLAGRAADLVDGNATPSTVTLIAWASTAALTLGLWQSRGRLSTRVTGGLLALVLLGELWLASLAMPYNDLADPAVYHDARMSVYQLQALADDPATSGRLLSISNAYFDPGDKSGLTARYAELGMTERATRYAFTAAKIKELVTGNYPLLWQVPSVDGYGGGLVPTSYYTQFTSLLLPSDDLLRPIDGRLRERLALEACRGACVPPAKWLDLMHVRYLIVDKTFDLSHEGIRYDTLPLTPPHQMQVSTDFVGDVLHSLYAIGDPAPTVYLDDAATPLTWVTLADIDGFTLAQAALDAPRSLDQVRLAGETQLTALTLVDMRTGDFMALPLGDWRLVLSSDIKLYERQNPQPRAFIATRAQTVPTTWDGTETALTLMRANGFDPAQDVILAADDAPTLKFDAASTPRRVNIREATDTRITFETTGDGVLVLSDAYFPGWKATVNGEPVMLYRANAMFRAVVLPEGENVVIMEYAPDWLSWVFVVGGAGWLLVLIALMGHKIAGRILGNKKAHHRG